MAVLVIALGCNNSSRYDLADPDGPKPLHDAR
jgi:hypothetical protein